MITLVAKASAPTDPLPDPRSFPEDLDQILALLLRAVEEDSDPWLSTSAISALLLADFAISVNVRRVFSLLSSHPLLAARRKRRGEWQFTILDGGKTRIRTPREGVFIIDPGRPIPAIIELHRFLGRLAGTVRVCDPYLDPTTLAQLDACRPGVHVMLLTSRVRDEVTLRAASKQFTRNQRTLEIRVSSSGKLHDRYVADDSTAFLLGTSLNGVGKSQSAIIPVGPNVRLGLLSHFDAEWKSAKQWS